MSNEFISRITVSADICHGKPTIRGSRIMVETILGHLSAGDSVDDLLEVFPDIEREDVLAALAYASLAVNMKGTVLKAA
jgi:uncharacterized protein (DUF433 family)